MSVSELSLIACHAVRQARRILTVRKTGETWLGFESTFDECRVVVEPMTKNTFGLIISTDPRIGAYLYLVCEAAGGLTRRNRITAIQPQHGATAPGRFLAERHYGAEMLVSCYIGCAPEGTQVVPGMFGFLIYW